MRISRWNRRTVAWVGGVLIAAILGLAAYDIVQGYRRTLDNAGHELEGQARLIAEQTARTLQAVDVALRHLAEQHRQGMFDGMKPLALHNYLREQAVGLVQVEGLGIIHPDGNARALSMFHPLPASVTNVAGMEIFQALRSGHRGLFIGDALKAPDGRWVLPLGRRIDTPAGGFAGAAAARGRIEYFEQFYRNVQLDPSTAISLMRQNGTLVARHPHAEEALGRRLPMFDEMMRTNGPMRAASPVDGVERIGVLKLVPDYPLAVIVTRDVASVLAPWKRQSTGTALRTLALSALAVALLVLLWRQLRRLQITQERYALAVAGSEDGVWDYDFVNNRVFASARAREISGLPPGPEVQTIEAWNAELKIHPDDVERRKAAQEAHFAGTAPTYTGEFRMLHPDGRYRWIRIHGLCLRDASGKPYRMAGSTSDIDARKRAEEALRLSEERYTLAVAGSDDGVWDFDFANRLVFASARAREICGLPPGPETQPMDEWFARLPIHPDDAPKRTALMEAHMAGATPAYEGEFRMRHGDGYRWVRIHGLTIRDAAGKPYRMAGSISDIDARRRAEDALRTSEEQYRSIFNAAADAFVLRDASAKVIDVNPAFLQLSGYSREEVLGGRHWIFAPPDAAALAGEMHRRVIAGEPVQAELKARRKDGTPIDIEMRAVPVLYRGQPHALGMARDITARKKAEAERLRLEGQLLQSKKLEAIGTLAGGIAHDFNNILAAILGYGDMAQKKAPEGSALRRHLDAVVAAGLRAKSLVARILAFSRSGIGERVPVHVQGVVTEALDLLAPSLPESVKLERHLAGGDATVMGDATQIHQVVMNLCANAAQAMKAGGRLTVALDVVERGEAMAATSQLAAGRYVRLSVRDTGIGIAPQILERIFDPFFTTREVGVGTGLGLSLVHGIVTELGGGIDVDSKVGEGTTFTVYLPWSSAAAASILSEEDVPQGSGETVLLVDDEEALVRLGEEMLAELGYEPVGFTSAKEALAAFREDPDRFQAALSDEAMADLSGSDLAKAIREVRPELPVVLMSGYVSPLFATRARNIGVVEVLSKPLVARDIARALANALRSRHAV
jgi:PAS domain S-box-containing protein